MAQQRGPENARRSMRLKDRKRCPGTGCRRSQIEVVAVDQIPAEARDCALSQLSGWQVTVWKHCRRCCTWWAELKHVTSVPRGMVGRRRVVVGLDGAGWAPADFEPIFQRV